MASATSLIRGVLISLPLIALLNVHAATAQRSGDEIFQTYCAACHSTGWNGAPISGIKGDWEPRLANGVETMLQNSKQGLNTMPPMGTCTDCSDAELRAAIEMMLKF